MYKVGHWPEITATRKRPKATARESVSQYYCCTSIPNLPLENAIPPAVSVPRPEITLVSEGCGPPPVVISMLPSVDVEDVIREGVRVGWSSDPLRVRHLAGM